MVSLPSNTPRKVLLNDKIIALFELIRHSNKQPLINKLDIYRKINRAQLNNKIRILCLYGLVQNNNGVTLGLLLTYINYRHITLLYIVEPGTEVLLRERQAAQIQEAIGQLHDARIVQGDAKPDNVLININKDTWLIIFSGGYTGGQVPKILAGTMEGDRIALEKILEYIRTQNINQEAIYFPSLFDRHLFSWLYAHFQRLTQLFTPCQMKDLDPATLYVLVVNSSLFHVYQQKGDGSLCMCSLHLKIYAPTNCLCLALLPDPASHRFLFQ